MPLSEKNMPSRCVRRRVTSRRMVIFVIREEWIPKCVPEADYYLEFMNMRLNIKFLYSVLLVSVLFIAGCSKDSLDPTPEPGGEEQIQEKAALKEAVKSMMSEASGLETTLNGVAVWQEGYASSGAWSGKSGRETRRQMWSVTKTFTSMAVGIAVGEGRLSLSEKVAPLFPEEVAEAEETMTEQSKANLEALTVRDLLIMANGHRKDPTIEYARKYFTKDPFGSLKYIHNEWVDVSGLLEKNGETLPGLFFEYPFEAVPGERFCYDSFSSCMLSEILTKKTGETMADYLYSRMFKPLGLDKPEWEDINGVTAGGWGLHLNTDEMLTFGRLLLDGGKWNGNQIIPEDYLRDAVTDRIKDRMNGGKDYSTTGYGYQVRTREDGSLYMAVGLFGQYIVVIPDKRAVIALTSAMPFDAGNILGDLPKIMDLLNGNLEPSVKPLELAWKHIVPVL